MKKRLLALVLIAALAFCLSAGLSGCSKNSLNSFTWFVSAIPANLDPQTATASEDVIACTHLYTRLFRKTAAGTLANDACESYTVSSDGLVYTFQLKSGLSYRKSRGDAADYSLTAQDFVFAFRRIFDAATASPYAASFSAIRGSSATLNGAQDALGVSAPDAATLVITLSARDDSLPEKLALPGAAPCNQAFFESTKGAYGLDGKDTLSSGAFYLYNWTESGLFLRRDTTGTAINNLRLVQNMDASGMTPEALIENEKCSAALDTSAGETSLATLPYSDTTWALVCNCSGAFSSANLRQALAADAGAVSLPADTALYAAAAGLVPAGAAVDGTDYRKSAGAVSVAGADAAAFAAGLSETGVDALKGLKILVPEGYDAAYLQALNSRWQQDYSLFFSIETVSAEDFEKRFAAGDFDLAVAPLTLTQSDPLSMLAPFSASPFYANPAYTALITTASSASGEARISALAAAEQLLVSDYAIVPLYAQNKRLLVAPDLTGLCFEPYGPVIDVTDAERAS